MPSFVPNSIILTPLPRPSGKDFMLDAIDVLKGVCHYYTIVIDILTQSFRCWRLKKFHYRNTGSMGHLVSQYLLARVPAPSPC